MKYMVLSTICPVFFLAIIALTLENSTSIFMSPYIFGGMLIYKLLIIATKRDKVYFLYLPSNSIILYVLFFFFMGSIAFKYGFVQLNVADQWRYYHLENHSLVTSYYLFAIATIMASQKFSYGISSLFAQRVKPITLPSPSYPPKVNTAGAILSTVLMVIIATIESRLPERTGSFLPIVFFFLSVYITYYLRVRNLRIRYFIYLLILFLLSYFFYSDRRIIAFYIFIVVFIENYHRYYLKIRVNYIITIFLIFILFVTIIIAMSIHRGVGDFDTDNVINALYYVKDYLSSEWAIVMLFHNLEGPGTIFHSYNAINYIMTSEAYSYGTTFLKLFFIPISRSIFFDKPDSMVSDYTTLFYPSFRESGGSYVPNLLAEFYWNFGMFSFLFIFLFFVFADSIYRYSIRCIRSDDNVLNVFYLSSLSYVVFFFRGSGIDLYLIYCVIFFGLAVIFHYYQIIARSIFKSITRICRTRRI